MGKIKDLFDSKKLAIVEGVGYPNPTYSHFKAMDIWQAADPQGSLQNGWLGRTLIASPTFRGIRWRAPPWGRNSPKPLRRQVAGSGG